MSTSTSTQQRTERDSSLRSISGAEGNPVRPQPALLKLLQTVGARGDTFTLKQVMHYLGQYIMVKQLFDKQQQHIVHCGADELGELLGITTFSVKDPSPLYEMLKKNLYRISCTDAADSSSSDQTQDTGGFEPEKTPKQGIGIGDGSRPLSDNTNEAACSSFLKRHAEDVEDPENSKQPRLDLAFEEWDGAGLPWWFLGNLRANYSPQSNGSTDIPSNQDIDTALVSDSTDDLWFLNDCRSDQINVEVKVETLDSQDSEGKEVKEDEGKKVIELTINEDDLEDTQSLSDTDTELTSEDCWQCANCHKFNSPVKRYCFRCWALRKDWYADCPRLVHTLSTPVIPAKSCAGEDKDGIDIPDCRRTVSAPMVRPQVAYSRPPSSSLDSLDLAASSKTLSASTDTLLSFQSEEVTLESSRPLLQPCQLCQRRPRNGNVVHGRTAHMVACFTCARSLQKTRKGCPVCQKPIQMVVKTYVA
ncbi:protein Mdm4 [Spea bombifrons]|uniref:protein Mdm4 n=1 Tax=Spea bombifrons TaxID=233779 RepID=UPI002349F2D3|nr:protein Mdm4 [Spea bombifrons]